MSTPAEFDPEEYAERAAQALHRFRSAQEMARHKLTPVDLPQGGLLLTIPEWPSTDGWFENDAKEVLDVIYTNMRNANATCVIALSFQDGSMISKSSSIKTPCTGRLICGPDAGLATVVLPSPIHGIIIPPNYSVTALVTPITTAPALKSVLSLLDHAPASRPH